MSYRIQATEKTPALILYLLDISRSMTLPMGGRRRLDIALDSLTASLKQMVFRSTKGGRLSPRYRVALIAYSDAVYDLLGGIRPIDEVARKGIPDLVPQRLTETAEAFAYAEKLLLAELPGLDGCPAPLVCHITDGTPTGADPEPVVRRIMDMTVPDGAVLVENIFISEHLLAEPVGDVRSWGGIQDDTPFLDETAVRLRRMSSRIPESYLELLHDSGYPLAAGSYMMLPGSSAELVGLGFQMSSATPVR
ncbi:hypothetical protein PM3016_344 [Paenibacillus mucilaginosus 3016]|uniref:VWFA domain-containing protein n=2 Tax=Paenibacillus mucilaginosus TaxID=61624 RepID=H6NRN8_9BACL|nr:vWA domain-containing protein [Paenibacillus mucilaginosus]AFC27320.1 hypothetical protein PM3016_344 [Paenibacillus mucilaginosus 3016]AFH59465.1 hypothetical protein B2K_01760 [Paenibacillus mucilaginosus K02]WFA16233.1 VWA domain-containing protein [Paenibacillus mucilaginosus]